MKKLIFIVTAILLSIAVFAQSEKSATKKTFKAEKKYCCPMPKCKHCASSEGTCEHHKKALVEENKYYCPMCDGMVSDQPGKCSKCNMDMIKMEMKSETAHACPKCDWKISPAKGKCPPATETVNKDGRMYCVRTHEKGGKCPKCGTEMDRIEKKEKLEKKEKEEKEHEHHQDH